MIQINDCRAIVNNKDLEFMPNTFRYTEGLGEQQMSAVSSGGGSSEQLYSEDVSTHISKVMLDVPVTVDTVKKVRAMKKNKNRNVIQAVAKNDEGEVLKTFTRAALLGDYEVAFGSDTVITLEFSSDPAV